MTAKVAISDTGTASIVTAPREAKGTMNWAAVKCEVAPAEKYSVAPAKLTPALKETC